MKQFVAIILMTIIGYSIGEPLFDSHDDEAWHVCCDGADGECADDCCPMCCVPFHACNAGHVIEPVIFACELPAPPVEDFYQIPYIQHQAQTFVGDIWQPPKI
ncbi:MAG: hypothetical protein LBR84_09450 [Tannerella sp.]|nr:hypothetical protein [Tannerella sp.]